MADIIKKREDSPEPKDNNPKSPIPPTAVVVPLGHKNKNPDSPSPEKRVRFKRKRDCLEDVHHDKSVRSDEKLSSNTKKYTSPLDKADSQEVDLNGNISIIVDCNKYSLTVLICSLFMHFLYLESALLKLQTL